MTTHLEQELENIKSRMFDMADLAIEAIRMSVESLKKADIRLAQQIIQNDSRIDKLEVTIDEACIKVLVTKQPAAVDLRLVLAILKITTDIERISDLATGIAKETIRLNGKPTLKPLIDIPRMAAISIDMIKDTLLAITEKNASLAKKTIEKDREIDELNIQIFRELFSFMNEYPNAISEALGLIMVAKALERIGDHATNIAEKAIYYIEGRDIRHQDEL
jgi:phosphate transport system protein